VRRFAALLLALIAGVTVAPVTALAQSTPSQSLLSPGGSTSPFSPGLPQAPVSIPTTTTAPPVVNTSTNSTDSGLSGSGVLAIAIGALVVLGGISFFIWRDARRRAPVRAAAATAGGRSRAGSKAAPKPRKLSPAERKRRKRGRAR
jgi:hypothetical protein